MSTLLCETSTLQRNCNHAYQVIVRWGFFWSTYHVLDLKLDVIVVNRDHLHSNPHTNGQIMHILSASLQPIIRDVKHFILDMHVRDKH